MHIAPQHDVLHRAGVRIHKVGDLPRQSGARHRRVLSMHRFEAFAHLDVVLSARRVLPNGATENVATDVEDTKLYGDKLASDEARVDFETFA